MEETRAAVADEVTTEHLVQADKEYQLAEYGRLTSEIEKRVEMGLQFFDRLFTVAERSAAVAGLFLTLAGLVLGIGNRFLSSVRTMDLLLAVLCIAAALAFWCCPLMLAFLGGLVGENDLRIAQINYHLKHEHEKQYLPRGWETVRHQTFKPLPLFVSRQARGQYHALAPREGRKLLSMRGLFTTVQSLFLMVGAVCTLPAIALCLALLPFGFALLLICVLALLLAGGVALTVFTWFAIEHRRDRE